MGELLCSTSESGISENGKMMSVKREANLRV